MSNGSNAIVQKVWNFCNIRRGGGVGCDGLFRKMAMQFAYNKEFLILLYVIKV